MPLVSAREQAGDSLSADTVRPADARESLLEAGCFCQRVSFGSGNRRIFPSPGQLRGALEFLQCCFRLECRGFAGKGLCAKHANRRVGAREFRAFAAGVSGEAGCDVGRDAGVGPAIAAHQQIEPPVLGHADRLLDAASLMGRRRRFKGRGPQAGGAWRSRAPVQNYMPVPTDKPPMLVPT